MPVRASTPAAPAAPAKKPAAPAKTPAKKSAAKPEAAIEDITPVEETSAPAAKATVQKFPAEESAMRFMKKYCPEVIPKIAERINRNVKTTEGTLACFFCAFQEDGEGDGQTLSETENIAIIKDVLFAYHKKEDGSNGGAAGKGIMIEVLSPETPGTEGTVLLFHDL